MQEGFKCHLEESCSERFPSAADLNEHIKFHKFTGRLIFVYSLVHCLAHLGNIGESSKVSSVPLLLVRDALKM